MKKIITFKKFCGKTETEIHMGRGWRDGSDGKSTCSCRGPGIGSKYSHSPLNHLTPFPGDSVPSADLLRHQAHM